MKRAILATVIGSIAIGLAYPCLSTWALAGGGGDVQVLSGDVNGDGARSISDAVYLLRFLYSGGPTPVEPQEPMASPELVAAIQDAATRMEERLSAVDSASSPLRASLADPIWPDILLVRDTPTWTQSFAREIGRRIALEMVVARTLAVHWTGWSFDNSDDGCADRCSSTHQECRFNCGTNADCILHCDLNFASCLLDCND